MNNFCRLFPAGDHVTSGLTTKLMRRKGGSIDIGHRSIDARATPIGLALVSYWMSSGRLDLIRQGSQGADTLGGVV